MRTVQSTCIFLGLTLGFSAALSAAPAEIELRYQRDAATAPQSATVRPATPPLPDVLRLEAAEVASAATSELADIDTRAGLAALLAALDRAEGIGRRESYRLGFYDGLQTAGSDPVLGRRDYGEGTRRGTKSSWARELGLELGAGEAGRAAAAAAYGHVTVDDGPAPAKPRPVAPPFAASPPAVRAPNVEDVLRETTVAGVLERQPPEGLAGVWERAGVLELYRAEDRGEIYDGRWADAAQAFSEWLHDRRNLDGWQRLDGAEQAAFHAAFERHFRSHLAHFFAGDGAAAYRSGFADGWDYGAFVSREWNFRQGFTDGFLAEVRETAEATFYDRYPELYAARYRQLFRERSFVGAADRGDAASDRPSTVSYLRGGDR